MGPYLQKPLPGTRAGLGWGSGGANPTATRTQPCLPCPAHLPRAVWQLSVQTAQSDSTGGARSAWAARSYQCHCRDACQTLLPGCLPQPQSLRLEVPGSHSHLSTRVTATITKPGPPAWPKGVGRCLGHSCTDTTDSDEPSFLSYTLQCAGTANPDV